MSDLEMLQADGTWKKVGTVDPKTIQDLVTELFETEIPGNLAEGETVQEFRIPTPKHTPGPWFGMIEGRFADTDWMAENDEASVSASAPITDSNGQTVALVVSEEWDDSELAANACLIAQAPTLLADLTDAAAQLRKLGGEVNAALAARFEATIAAAVGGAE